MNTTPILTAPWPRSLDPAIVPFKKRTVTILHRKGMFTDPSLLDDVTTGDVLSWWNAGPVTVKDLRVTGNEAIRRHHAEADLLKRLASDLSDVASLQWTRHIWHRDPRFAKFVPKGDSTVYEVSTSGSAIDRRFLWDHLEGLRAAIDVQASLSLLDAVSQYVEAISGQHGERLDALLAQTGLNGRDPITGAEAARQLGVSQQRIHQIRQQLCRNRDRANPLTGIWIPQIDTADRDGWPESISANARTTIQSFFVRNAA